MALSFALVLCRETDETGGTCGSDLQSRLPRRGRSRLQVAPTAPVASGLSQRCTSRDRDRSRVSARVRPSDSDNDNDNDNDNDDNDNDNDNDSDNDNDNDDNDNDNER